MVQWGMIKIFIGPTMPSETLEQDARLRMDDQDYETSTVSKSPSNLSRQWW